MIKEIDKGEWRAYPRSPKWAGHAVAKVLDLNATDKGDRARIATMLETWIANKVLKIVVKEVKDRHPYEFVEVGRPAV